MASRGDKTIGDNAFTAESLYGTNWQPTYAGALSFLRRKYTRDLTGVDVAVTGLPFDLATTNRPGTRFGPAGIRRASAQLAWGPPWPWGFNPVDRLAIIDYGDCNFPLGYTEKMVEAAEAHATEIIEGGASMLTLGGDHYITLPLLRAHAKKYGPLSLVHFDAHSDTWRDDAYHHGTMFYHASTRASSTPSARSTSVSGPTTPRATASPSCTPTGCTSTAPRR
jgi:agmatinase